MKNVISHIGSVSVNNGSVEFATVDNVAVQKHSVLVFGYKKNTGYYAIELPTNLRKYDELSVIKAVSKAVWASEIVRTEQMSDDVKANCFSMGNLLSSLLSGFAIVPCDRFGEPINSAALIFADGLRKSFKTPKGTEKKPQPLRSILVEKNLDWADFKVGELLMSYCKAVKTMRTYTSNVDYAIGKALESVKAEQLSELRQQLSEQRAARAAAAAPMAEAV